MSNRGAVEVKVKCPHCSREWKNKAESLLKCPHCNEVFPMSNVGYCVRCGLPFNDPSDKFCIRCGDQSVLP